MLRDLLVRMPSPRVRGFHLVAGTFAPVLFLVFDPIVFRADRFRDLGAYLGPFRAFGYAATVMAAVLLARALLRPSPRPLEAGMLYGAAFTALLLGLILLPVTFLGLFFAGIGVLGLSPFLASWVYFRNASRQHIAAKQTMWSGDGAIGAAAFLSLAIVVQLATNEAVGWTVRHIEKSWAPPVMEVFALIYDTDQLLSRYEVSQTPQEKAQLSKAFWLLTGETIEGRLERLRD